MIVSDNIYGQHDIEGVLEELMLSKPVQRLKGVHQGGASYLVNEKWNVTRFDHSVGVMLLIKKLGGSLEEQIAGLLHDVSHTAFSHVIDFVLDCEEEDYHEKIFNQVIMKSEIPSILKRYGYQYETIIESEWKLLEQPAPELCADRVDYTLRDMYHYGNIRLESVRDFLGHIIIVDGRMCLNDLEAAVWFVKTYYGEVIDFFMEPLNIYGYDALAKTLKWALDKNLISLDDLLGEDEEVMRLLKSIEDDDLQNLLKRIHGNVLVQEAQWNYDIHLKNKVRLIDPSVIHGTQLVQASSLSENVKNMNIEAYKNASRGVYLKIISNDTLYGR
ncbi:HD domain-containing protein [Peribacillus muralis]|uniref:HD domain-containing protein n=1 Tax=Peribacillus muralis TaxID=264697 RepID=UPI001F4E65F9|nr:HD domain-containing protein [Peribacillus muralis]MCK1991972.1 HD domain-containing protein [Peribacillus muralis]MCK2012530.1 HD domain-containing protein [Peribacillus muralis]